MHRLFDQLVTIPDPRDQAGNIALICAMIIICVVMIGGCEKIKIFSIHPTKVTQEC